MSFLENVSWFIGPETEIITAPDVDVDVYYQLGFYGQTSNNMFTLNDEGKAQVTPDGMVHFRNKEEADRWGQITIEGNAPLGRLNIAETPRVFSGNIMFRTHVEGAHRVLWNGAGEMVLLNNWFHDNDSFDSIQVGG